MLMFVDATLTQEKQPGFMAIIEDRERPLPWAMVFGVLAEYASYSTWVLPDTHWTHQRLSWLLNDYKREFGRYPSLFNDMQPKKVVNAKRSPS